VVLTELELNHCCEQKQFLSGQLLNHLFTLEQSGSLFQLLRCIDKLVSWSLLSGFYWLPAASCATRWGPSFVSSCCSLTLPWLRSHLVITYNVKIPVGGSVSNIAVYFRPLQMWSGPASAHGPWWRSDNLNMLYTFSHMHGLIHRPKSAHKANIMPHVSVSLCRCYSIPWEGLWWLMMETPSSERLETS